MEKEKKVENRSSIEVSRTSKGAYSWSIKRYYDEQNTLPGDVIAVLKSIDIMLKDQFKGEE